MSGLMGIMVFGLFVSQQSRTFRETGEVKTYLNIAVPDVPGGTISVRVDNQYKGVPADLPMGSKIALPINVNAYNERVYYKQVGPVAFGVDVPALADF